MFSIVVWNGMDLIGLIILLVIAVLIIGFIIFIKVATWIEDCKKVRRLRKESYKKAKEMRDKINGDKGSEEVGRKM